MNNMLVYTNSDGVEVGALKEFYLDMEIGGTEDFELTVNIKNSVMSANCLFYIENTEYGGIVDFIKVNTSNNKLTYGGRTWRGILKSHIIKPQSGNDYYTVSGSSNTIISNLITYLGLDNVSLSATATDFTIGAYNFIRYTDLLSGLTHMLETANAKLIVRYSEGIVLDVKPVVDYSDDREYDNDSLKFELTKHENKINHLICLGSGELKNREVVDLYADESGNISQTPISNSITATYDYPNAESTADLILNGAERLKELRAVDGFQVLSVNADLAEIGDYVGGRDYINNLFIKQKIARKIINMTQDTIKIQHEVN